MLICSGNISYFAMAKLLKCCTVLYYLGIEYIDLYLVIKLISEKCSFVRQAISKVFLLILVMRKWYSHTTVIFDI